MVIILVNNLSVVFKTIRGVKVDAVFSSSVLKHYVLHVFLNFCRVQIF